MRINKLSFLLTLAMLLIVTKSCSQGNPGNALRNNPESREIFTYYENLLQDLVKKQNIPALSIAVVDKEGIVWSACFGQIGSDTPNTAETMFSIQSISKTYTATALMIAAKEGILDLDTPLSEYLPEFSIQSYFDKEPMDLITLRHLLSHTAGFTHEAPVGNNYTYDSPSFEEHVLSIQQTFLRYPVGQRFAYSNLGMDLAAYVLQEVSGQAYYQYLKEKLLDPLGMKNTSADPEVILSSKNRAAGHTGRGEEKRVVVPMMGAGGVYSSLNDMARFVQFHLNEGEVDGLGLFGPSHLKEMYNVPFPVKDQTGGYALGIDTYQKHNSLFLNHGGGGYGYLADMAWYKDHGLGLVLLTNSTKHDLQGRLYHEILNKLMSAKGIEKSLASEDETIQEIKLSEAKMQNLSGTYLGRGASMKLELSDGSLGMKKGGQYTPFSFYADDEARMPRDLHYDYYRFVLDEEGNPDYIVKLNGGRTWDYNDGPLDARGPEKVFWSEYQGDYAVKLGGLPISKAHIESKNGYLYVSYMGKSEKLEEMEPGVFMTPRGEVLQFGKPTRFASIFELHKAEQE